MQSYFMWDSFASGIATSIMRNTRDQSGENEFAEMEVMNITIVTSNNPYGVYDGSNPFFDGLKIPKFNLKKGGVHSGHVQTRLRDQFCIVKNEKGKCKVILKLKQKNGFSIWLFQNLLCRPVYRKLDWFVSLRKLLFKKEKYLLLRKHQKKGFQLCSNHFQILNVNDHF